MGLLGFGKRAARVTFVTFDRDRYRGSMTQNAESVTLRPMCHTGLSNGALFASLLYPKRQMYQVTEAHLENAIQARRWAISPHQPGP